MHGFPDCDLEGVPGTMSRVTVLASDEGLVFENFPFDAISKVCRTPTQADHLIIGIPIAEGVVSGMYEDKASALTNKFYCGLFGFLSPLPSVVVENDSLMFPLERIPFFPCGVICLLIFFISRFSESNESSGKNPSGTWERPLWDPGFL